MKKIILSIILLFFIYFVPNIAYGQNVFNINSFVPGVGCGIAGDTEGHNICCNIPTAFECNHPVLQKLQSFLDYIPGVGNSVDDFLTKCKDLQTFVTKTNDTACITGEQSTPNTSSPNCLCVDNNISNPNQAITNMCGQYLKASQDANELKNCLSCAGNNGMWTGLGCLPLDLNTLISTFVLSTGIGIGGTFALLCIIYSALMMQSSQVNPDKLKKAQEMITSCIMGLMLIIFSVFIMKLIGVNILRIPGFG